jgi:hypothetical protein
VDGRGEHVGIAVPVEVGGEDRLCSIAECGDDLLGPEAARAVCVLVPGDLVVEQGGGEHVGIAVAVEVCGEDP